jgi:hypothetical protein
MKTLTLFFLHIVRFFEEFWSRFVNSKFVIRLLALPRKHVKNFNRELNEQRRIDAYAKHIQDCGPVPGFWKNERIEEIRAQAKANYKVPVIRNVDFSEDKNV